MKRCKKLCALLVVGAMLAGSSCTFAKSGDITVLLDGKAIAFDVQPQIIDGSTMVPLRKIFEEIGALVKWDGDTQTVSARKSAKTITMQIASADMLIDKGKTDDDGNAVAETVTLDVPAQIVSGRTLVPLRAVSEAFGLDVAWDAGSSTVVITSKADEDESWKENTAAINLDDLTYSGDGVAVLGNQITISKGGDYTVSGALSDGSIIVTAEEKVKIRLSGASITSTDGPCIYFEHADKAFLTLSDGTENTLTAQNSENGALYSKEDLEIKGGGTLQIHSQAGHGIKASDNLSIKDGIIHISSSGDGVHINDTFQMSGGAVTITAGADGVDSESIVMVTGGSLNVTTTGEPVITEPAASDSGTPQGFPGAQAESADVEFTVSSKGVKADWMLVLSGGNITVSSSDHAIHCADEIEITGGVLRLCSNYAKGISGHGNVTIGGDDTWINITKSTEGIESKDVLTVNGGTIQIIASDDGMNATGGVAGIEPQFGAGRPAGGFRREQSAENADGAAAGERPGSQNPGVFPGVPATGGAPMPGGMNPPPGSPGTEQNGTEEITPPDSLPEQNNSADTALQPDPNRPAPGMGGGNAAGRKDALIINGGDIEVYAGDDCFDSNGNLVVNGGTIKAVKSNGSFIDANAVFDPDGTIRIADSATLVIAAGASTNRSLNISQNSITIYADTALEAGDTILVKDESGDVVIEYAPKGSYSAVLIASPQLSIGNTYAVSIGANDYTVVQSEAAVTVGNAALQPSGGFGRR